MAATIRTVSKTTASLSDAKNLKTGPRCQEGRAEEMVAMIGRAVSARIARGSTIAVAQPSWLWDQLRKLSGLIEVSCVALRVMNFSAISCAVPLLFSPAFGPAPEREDFFAPPPVDHEPQIRFPRHSCFSPRAYWAVSH